MTAAIMDPFAPVRGGHYRLESISRSHVGHVRRINEDRVFDDAAAGLWAVADGMGGHSGGDLAAQQVIDSLRAETAGAPDVRRALLAANAAIVARNRRLRAEAGATAVAASFADGVLDILWAGDSRAYRLSDGHLEQLTRDHSVVQSLIDAGLLTPAAAERHPQAHVVTRALGVDPDVDIDRVAVTISPSDRPARFLLCSDGLSRSLTAADRVPDAPLPLLADMLLRRALERDGSDNVSLVLIEITAIR